MDSEPIPKEAIVPENVNSCDNCRMLDNKQPHGEHCYMFAERPVRNLCHNWKKSVNEF